MSDEGSRSMLESLRRPEAEELYARLAREATRRRRERSILKAVGSMTSVALVGGALIWAGFSLWAALGDGGARPGAGTAANYRFDEQPIISSVQGESVLRVGLAARPSWTANEFPGWHRCTWTATGPDGAVLGETSEELVSLSQTAVDPLSPSIAIRLDESTSGVNRPEDVTIGTGCDPERLDAGERYAYDFRDLEVQAGDDAAPSLTLRYDAVWLGSGHPGVMSCTFRIFDSQGGEIATQTADLVVGSSPARGLIQAFGERDLVGPVPQNTSQLRGAIDCVPFSETTLREGTTILLTESAVLGSADDVTLDPVPKGFTPAVSERRILDALEQERGPGDLVLALYTERAHTNAQTGEPIYDHIPVWIYAFRQPTCTGGGVVACGEAEAFVFDASTGEQINGLSPPAADVLLSLI